jgi:uncharacterized RDD family membrane protein YckC
VPGIIPEEVQAVLRRAESRPLVAPTSELPLFVKGIPQPEAEPVASAANQAATPAVTAPTVFSLSPAMKLDPPPTPVATPPASTVASRMPARPEAELDDVAGLVPAAPAPLSVRRKVAEPVTHTAKPPVAARKLGPLDRDLLEDLQRIEKAERRDAAAQARKQAREVFGTDRAGAGRRAAAAAFDAVFLGGISAAVVAITLRWCEIPLESARILPVLPTAAFLLLVGGGYLVMFTAAGGQTIGKMLLGLRVVGGDSPDTDAVLTFGQAAYRSLLALPSVLALGAGFVPALIGEERALHDRLAHTRVVRA